MIDFKQYIKELQSTPIDEITEHSKRYALETILRELAVISESANQVNVLHEPKRKDNYGSPDFKVYTADSIIGYVENKKITENLDKIIKSEQIKKYRELSQNLLITNYIEFVWIKDDVVQRENLCYLSDIENKKFKLDKSKAESVERLLLNFFSQAPEKISYPKDLAIALAVRCKNLKDFISDELSRQEQEQQLDVLYELYKAFKDNIFEELTISEFSDAFAQMLAYGLFLAGLNADTKPISLQNAKYHIPTSFQLIKELIKFLDELEKPEYKETKWIIDEIISIINNINWVDFKLNMSFNKKLKDSEDIETDPYIYFYETFLATYDYSLRKSKGVYYTPPQVVNFIVRAIDEILKTTFKLPNGLADRNKVTVLDFATGTGTFLLEIFKVILDSIPSDSPEKRRMLIQDHILKNLFGFEYLIAPYTIAHLKLSQYLKENGYEFQDSDRLQVYLTNTLEPVDKQTRVQFMPQLSKETQAAQKIKDTPILVITGNPPYSGHSKNTGKWISNKLKDYYRLDGKALNEQNSKWLQDDYVKFIRFAQDKMENVEQGVIGIITNHSFLDNPTFRGMRQSLMNTFDQLYLIDLQGNSLKKETSAEGGRDENVFDIKQGVCISLFIKKKGLKKGIFHTDFWGNRKEKFKQCTDNNLSNVSFEELKPNTPFYLFKPQNQTLRAVYDKFWSVKEIFDINSVGIVTANDNLTIDFSLSNLKQKYKKLCSMPIYDIKQEFNLSNKFFENRKYFFENIKDLEVEFKEIVYRPFDTRFILWNTNLIERPREQVMQHFENDNLGLITIRRSRSQDEWNYVLACNKIIAGATAVTSLDINYVFPLYRYNGNGNGNGKDYLFNEDGKKDNFLEAFRKYINEKYKKKYSPEQIFAYIYSVLHSKTFREKYGEFLKMDFPRIPFVDDNKTFEKLSQLGKELYEKHINPIDDSSKEYKEIGVYKGVGDNIVIQPEFRIEIVNNSKHYRLYINKTQYFETISEKVYNFRIGGYKVIEKFIKDRKGMDFYPFFEQAERIIKTLTFTINQMDLMDKESKGWV